MSLSSTCLTFDHIFPLIKHSLTLLCNFIFLAFRSFKLKFRLTSFIYYFFHYLCLDKWLRVSLSAGDESLVNHLLDDANKTKYHVDESKWEKMFHEK